MSIDSTWLRCPNCFSDLAAVGERTFGCSEGHRFDRSKHGLLTLLPPKAPRTVGDDREMLDARASLLGRGAYSPISEALVAAVRALIVATGADSPRIADLGCGTGHYSHELSQAFPAARFLVADRSVDAVRMSLRAVPGATGIVLDIWRPLPLRNASADVVLDVFAPRNASEFARVIRPGGRLLVVVPTEAHLHELRRDGLMLDVPPGKSDRLAEQLTDHGFGILSVERVEYSLAADDEIRRLLAGMGPSAHHAPPAPVAERTSAAVAGEMVTVSVELVAFERLDVA